MTENRALVVAVGRFSSVLSADAEPGYGFTGWPPLSFVYDVAPRVERALTKCFYEVTTLVDPDRRQLRDSVEKAIEDGSFVVHVISHGRSSDKDPTRLDVVPASGDPVMGLNVGEWISSAEHLGRPMLFLLDLCRAGRAARLPFMLQLAGYETNAWVVAAAAADEDAYDGRFSSAVADVLEQLAIDGLGTDPTRPFVSFSTFARFVGRRIESMSGIPQRVHASVLDPAQDEPILPFFANPRYVDDPRVQVRDALEPALRAFVDDLDDVFDARHFLDRLGSHFTGRHRELQALAPWLDGKDRAARPLMIVTGSPGVGKSALIGALVCAAHPALGAAASLLRERLRPSERPRVNQDLAAVHARHRRLSEVMASLGRQLQLQEPPSGWTPPRLIEAIGDRRRPPFIVLDALDEALDPVALMTVLLTPLALTRRNDGQPICWLMLGMRPWEQFAPLHELAEKNGALIDLDDVQPKDLRDDLKGYITARLNDLPGYEATTEQIRACLAEAVGARLVKDGADRQSWGEFLVAGVFCRYLESVPPPQDGSSATSLGGTVPRSLPAVLELDLAAHDNGPAIRAVLAALAFAKGDGMPTEMITSVAIAFSARLTRGDIGALLNAGRFYLRTAVDRDGVTLFRLFHQGLADYLRRHPRRAAVWDVDENASSTMTADTGLVFDQLTRGYTHVPGGVSPWQLAPPYLLRHAIQHAAEADRVDQLLLDADFLVHAEPATLGPELRNARSEAAQEAAAVYRTSASVHRNLTPLDRRWLLTIDALRYQARDLAAQLAMAALGEWQPLWATGSKLSNALLDTLVGHSGPVSAVTCATVKGRKVAVSAGRDGTIRIWDLSSAEQVGPSLTGHQGPVDFVVDSVLGGRPVVVSGGRDGTVRVWDLTQGEQIGAPRTTVIGPVTALACGSIHDRAVVVIGDQGGITRAFALDDGSPVGSVIRGLAGGVTALVCLPQTRRPIVVIGDRGPMIRAYDLSDGCQLDRAMIGAGPVTAIRVLNTNFYGKFDVSVIHGRGELTNVPLNSEGIFSWQSRSVENVSAVSATTVGSSPVVILGTPSGTVELNILNGRKTRERQLLGHTGAVRGIAATKVQRRSLAVTASDDETVRVWDLARGVKEKKTSGGHIGTVTAAACAVNSGVSLAVTGGRNGMVLTWDLRTGAPLGASPSPAKRGQNQDANPRLSIAHMGPVRGIAVAFRDGKCIAVSVGRDRTVRRWDLASVRQINRSMLGHSGPVNTVSVVRLDDAYVAVTGGDDAMLLLWDIGTGRRLGSPLTGHSSSVTAVASTVIDGNPVAVSAGRDGSLRLWDLRQGRQVTAVAAGHSGTVTGIETVLAGSSTLAITVGTDRTVRRWELPALRPIGSPMSGHTEPISAVTVTQRSDDAVLVTGARDRTVRLWRALSGQCIDQLILPSPVQCVTAAPDGSLLVCADWEAIVLGPSGSLVPNVRPK